MGRVMIVADEADLVAELQGLFSALTHQVAVNSEVTTTIKTATAFGADVVVLSENLDSGPALPLLPRLKELPTEPEVIVLTESADLRNAEFALRNDAWDYLDIRKGLNPVALATDQALAYRKEKSTGTPPAALKRERIIGNSTEMKACFALLGQAAASDANVLITGETGTGKELFARAIHSNSPRARQGSTSEKVRASNPRADKNFVVVDCTALPETLVESVLFGYVRGAFTGADRAQDGLIAQADGGTLFLDEVGELPLATQKAFLRVLQERRYRPIGAKKELTSNFRLIAATNRDLDEMQRNGEFRKDLLFRLRALAIELPPLRRRRQDIKSLVRYHTKRLCESYNMSTKGFSGDLLETLTCYAWPGNVRELVNTIDGILAVAGNSATLYPKHLPVHIRVQVASAGLQPDTPTCPEIENGPPNGTLPDFKTYRADMERRYLQDLLALTQRNIPRACKLSGISRSRLYELMAKYELGSPQVSRVV